MYVFMYACIHVQECGGGLSCTPGFPRRPRSGGGGSSIDPGSTAVITLGQRAVDSVVLLLLVLKLRRHLSFSAVACFSTLPSKI